MQNVYKKDSITVLDLPVRARNCLKRAGIDTVEKLLACTEEDLFRVRHAGKATVKDIQTCCAQIKLLEDERQLDVQDFPVQEHAAPDAGQGSRLFFNLNGQILSDYAIEALPLSVRTMNCLHRAGIEMASQLVGLSRNDLLHIRNMGVKSADEVWQCIQNIRVLSVPETDEQDNTFLQTFQQMAQAMAASYGDTPDKWMWEIALVHKAYPDASEEDFLSLLYSQSTVRDAVKQRIFDILAVSCQPLRRTELAGMMPRHLENTTILDEILNELEWKFAIRTEADDMGSCFIRHRWPTLRDGMEQLVQQASTVQKRTQRERLNQILTLRLSGKTMEEAGAAVGVTRERVRQMESKALTLLHQIYPTMDEDRYLPVFERYNFSQEEFRETFKTDDTVFYYLQMMGKKKIFAKRPALEMLSDESIPIQVRQRADVVLHRDYVKLDGQWVRQARTPLVEYYIAHFCQQAIAYQTFSTRFDDFLRELPVKDAVKQQILERSGDIDNSIKNHLRDSEQILWSKNQHFRYYNKDAFDFSELLEAIDLDSCEDVEISARKFFRDDPELMARYDIRNEYELHNLLKKLWKGRSSRVVFSRMPTIRIGNGSYEKQVLALLQQEGAMTTEEICQRFEELYGVKQSTCFGCYLSQPGKIFFMNGIHRVDCEPMPKGQKLEMQKQLRNDFYTIREVQERYHHLFPQMDDTDLTPYQLKDLGFQVYTGYHGYLVRSTYASAREYFGQILQQDKIDLKKKYHVLNSISTFNGLQNTLRRSYELVEYAPQQLVHLRYLETLGVTREIMLAYTQKVANFVPDGEFFTVKSLQQDGCGADGLTVTGFGDWFYASILMEDTDDFSCQRIGGTRIFLRGAESAKLGDMLAWILEQVPGKKMELCQLEKLLQDRYGVVLPRTKLTEIMRGTSLFYEAVMTKTVYLDYDIYCEKTEELSR